MTEPAPQRFTETDLPEMFRVADKTSRSGQRAFTYSTALQLGLIVLAALGGALHGLLHQAHPAAGPAADWLRIGAGGAFIIAAIVKTYVLSTRPDRGWYAGRATAESVKTLAWRYAVGGAPFGLSEPNNANVDTLFVTRLHELMRSVRDITLVPSAETNQQITPQMRAIRATSLSERKVIYLHDRLEDQRKWYVERARSNAFRAKFWSWSMLGFELLGALAAWLMASGAVAVDLLGVPAALVGVTEAWLQTKQHMTLTSAYSVAARELADVQLMAGEPTNEDDWAAFVEESERAVSREHTLWRASRGA